MQRVNGGIRVAATDLSNFIQCKHLSLLDLAKTCAIPGLPAVAPPFAKLKALEDRGREHEEHVLQDLIDEHGEVVVRVPGYGEATDDERHRATAEALGDGAQIIYQGVLIGEQQLGAPDFLVAVQLLDPEDTGGGYVVLDAKLARSAKAAALLQTTFYSRLLAAQTGVQPTWMYLALGDGQSPTQFRVADFAAYERATYARMRSFLDDAGPRYPVDNPYPEKVEHCEICSWRQTCEARRRADDDLALVAGAALTQRKWLKAATLGTRTALAETDIATPVPDLDPTTFRRLHLQARAQRETEIRGEPRPYSEFADEPTSLIHQAKNAQLHHSTSGERREPLRGLFALPAPDPADIFFDLEAARFFGGGEEGFGLEYLFGYVTLPGEKPEYSGTWAFDRDGERSAFEAFIGMVHARWQANRGMHVYHYNHYEPTALGRLADRHGTMAEMLGALMGRYATMEEETDALLRGRVFVDLYPIFRQAIRAGIESYSLKQTERVAGYERLQELGDVTEQMVAFERELEEGPAVAAEDLEARQIIEDYNADDCRATLALRDWLEDQRAELVGIVGEFPRPPATFVAPEAVQSDAAAAATALRERKGDGEDDERRLLAGLLEYQRREDRPAWWEYFDVRGRDGAGLLDARAAIAGVSYVEPLTGPEGDPILLGTRPTVLFAFPPQDHRFGPGDIVFDLAEFRTDTVTDADGQQKRVPNDGRRWEVVHVDDASGTLVAAAKAPLPPPDQMPKAFVGEAEIFAHTPSDSLLDYAGEVLTSGGFSSRAPAEALLFRRPPTRSGAPIAVSTPAGTTDRAVEMALRMDAGCLPIQGPPGTGKTYTGAMLVKALLEEDSERRIGVAAYSHDAVSNFLDELRRVAPAGDFRIGQAGAKQRTSAAADESFDDSKQGLAALKNGSVQVLGGTAWLWSNPLARTEGGVIDTLIVDEAGQFPLAYAVAASGAVRRRLVLLGDPQQLAQVTRGTHPEGADASALGHILGGSPVLAADHGVFLDETRRMHDDITAFISEAFYRGELHGTPSLGLDRQALDANGSLTGSGLRLVDVQHVGNSSSSSEEARQVSALVADLLGGDWIDRTGQTRAIGPEDVLVVTPYNAQIREIAREIAARGISGIQIGTVDRFQGQQAPVVIYSMTSSSADDAPRGMEFLYRLNRLNVAVSRAMALGCIVMSPDLVRVDCRTPRQIQLASAHCRLREVADQVT